jgi:hypothetical protein
MEGLSGTPKELLCQFNTKRKMQRIFTKKWYEKFRIAFGIKKIIVLWSLCNFLIEVVDFSIQPSLRLSASHACSAPTATVHLTRHRFGILRDVAEILT